jgi:hypothetical protein
VARPAHAVQRHSCPSLRNKHRAGIARASRGYSMARALPSYLGMTEANGYDIDADTANVQTPAKDRSTARCACGHTANHSAVLPEPAYTQWGWLLFLIGVTAKPLAVLYRCLWCKQVLARTRDPKVLARFD